jgi:hypothetical protein
VATDFPSLVSLACHDLRTPLATVQGFVVLLDLLSLAARVEDGRYDPVLHEADSLALAPDGATGTGAIVNVDPEPVARALSSLARAAARHGGVDVSTAVDGPSISIEPVVVAAAPVVLGEDQKDLGAAVAVRLLRALGADVTLAGERLTVTLPT